MTRRFLEIRLWHRLMDSVGAKQPSPWRRGAVIATIAIMWGLKYHYSTASAGELAWILSPTATMVSRVMEVPFYGNPNVGYVSADQKYIIAPACAGLNFMIMAFGLTALTGLRHWKNPIAMGGWLAMMLIGAFFMTIGVNTLRILLSILLFEQGLSVGWFTPARLHRIAGITLYFGFLGAYAASASGVTSLFKRRDLPAVFDEKPQPTAAKIRNMADWWGWYVSGAIIVPLFHRLSRGCPAGSREHYLSILIVSLLVCLGVLIFWTLAPIFKRPLALYSKTEISIMPVGQPHFRGPASTHFS